MNLRELVNALRYVNEHVPSSPAKDTMLEEMGRKIDDIIRNRVASIIGRNVHDIMDNEIMELKRLFIDVCR